MSTPTPLLLTGIAQLLDARGVATWRSAGAYTAGETAVVLGGLPQSPDRVVALAGYGVGDDGTLSDSTIGVQVTTRWGGQDPRPGDELVDAVFDTLHGLHDATLPTGVRVVLSMRQSWTSLGQDANQRWRMVQNFYVTTHRPSAHRT